MSLNRLFSILMIAGCTTQLTAQNDMYKNTVSIGIGANAFGLVSKDLGANATPGEVKYKFGEFSRTPTFQLSFDRSIVKWFSAGAALSYNRAQYTYDGLEYKGQKFGTAALTAGRTTIGCRLFLHYFNAGKWDFYSGGRLGLGIWTGRLSLDVEDGLEQELLAEINENLTGIVPRFIRNRLVNNVGIRSGFIAPQLQFIPIAIRGFLNNNIGFGAEFALGSPYFLSAGLQYRFP